MQWIIHEENAEEFTAVKEFLYVINILVNLQKNFLTFSLIFSA